jgi:D-glycero-alpha-D-manno-heptose-7-phosphate kinase
MYCVLYIKFNSLSYNYLKSIKKFSRVCARAPLRIGLAGGGTDINDYFNIYSGATLNIAINKYAYAQLDISENTFIAESLDSGIVSEINAIKESNEIPNQLKLHYAVFNRIRKDFCNSENFNVRLSTYCDAPIGSGLGSSSTLVVAIIKAFSEFLNLGLDDYFIAELAYKIEREDCNLKGGKQDQYSAAFGGLNFIEFNKNNTIVNNLRLKSSFKCELESSLVLHFTGISRSSEKVILDQTNSIFSKKNEALDSLHKIKEEAFKMKNYILRGDRNGIRDSINKGWEYKLLTSQKVSNKLIEDRIKLGFDFGAEAAKVSGAGGGGFILFMCQPNQGIKLRNRLLEESVETFFCTFNSKGAEAWMMD